MLYEVITYNWFVLGRNYQAKRHACMEAVYKVANRFLQDLGVDYWLVYGTLLGYYRDRNNFV